jgi:Skp family chaperone for outer membrane proteins
VLGDPRALAALEKFALARKDTPEQAAAARATEAIENFHRPVEGLSSLRKEFLDLQQENRELRKDLDALQKKFDALNAKPAGVKQPPAPAKLPKQKSGS